MKIRFYCGNKDLSNKSNYDTPSECSGAVDLNLKISGFDILLVSMYVDCPKCKNRLDFLLHGKIISQ